MAIPLVSIDPRPKLVHGPVAARFLPPRPRPFSLLRPALLDRLRAAPGPLIVLSAPPGYGKSMLLVDWAIHETRPFVWITITTHDNDPVRFGRRLVAAVSQLQPTLGARSIEQAVADPNGGATVVVPALSEALAALETRR